jgi:arabinofuranosyltransferase
MVFEVPTVTSCPRSAVRVSRLPALFAALTLAPLVALFIAAYERRWMDDDGFINLRIVRNLLHGYGPVFNLDERVETGTSPAWIAFLAVLGGLGIRLEQAAVFGGIALSCLGLFLGLDAATRLSDAAVRSPVQRWGRAALPVGAAIFAALPVDWDYASSGLETGLALAWLGASYDALARRITRADGERRGGRRLAAEAALIGLGPLIRPELALYTLGLFVPLTLSAMQAGQRRRSAGSTVACVVFSAAALPVAYQMFRMGYYASMFPNSAIAKEAFRTNWAQGSCYFDNFFGTYRLSWPLVAASVFWAARAHGLLTARRWAALAATLCPTLAAASHVAYIVSIGGDYMHGRLFVPAIFGALLPVMTVPASVPRSNLGRGIFATCVVVLAVWLPVCAFKLRIGVENVCMIGDERGWYAREAKVDNPVELESYERHWFLSGAKAALQRAGSVCPGLSSQSASCRRVFLDENTNEIAPAPPTSIMSPDVDARVGAVVPAGAIGIFGYLAPERVHVVDVHGLADPIVARFELQERGRPGHEKRLSAAWTLARFARAAEGEDPSVTAARRALACQPLSSLESAIREPLTLGDFLHNITRAWDFSRLRIASDPFDAEQALCHTRPLPELSTGGSGGSAYRWRCPGGHALTALRGAYSAKDLAISRVQAVCGGSEDEQAAGRQAVAGPAFGEGTDYPFELVCPRGMAVTGIYGTADDLVRSVGFICSGEGGSLRSSTGGVDRGNDFALSCPNQETVIGIRGRSGVLVDAVGVACTS